LKEVLYPLLLLDNIYSWGVSLTVLVGVFNEDSQLLNTKLNTHTRARTRLHQVTTQCTLLVSYSYHYLDLDNFTDTTNVISYVLVSRDTVTATSQGQALDPPVWTKPRTGPTNLAEAKDWILRYGRGQRLDPPRTWLRGHKHQQRNWLAITVPFIVDTPQENYNTNIYTNTIINLSSINQTKFSTDVG